MKKLLKNTFKYLVVLLIMLVTCFVGQKAEATWYFTWADGSGSPGELLSWTDPQTGMLVSDGSAAATPWNGYFTVPDSAYTAFTVGGGSIDLSQFTDFWFLGTIWDGTLMRGTAFSSLGSALLGVHPYTDSNGVVHLDSSYAGDAMDFILEDPMGIHSSIQFIGDGQVGPNVYYDKMWLSNSSQWVDVSVEHPGHFEGIYVSDVVPVPEPSTVMLLGVGLVGAGFLLRNRVKRI